jgi:hypothetical protein
MPQNQCHVSFAFLSFSSHSDLLAGSLRLSTPPSSIYLLLVLVAAATAVLVAVTDRVFVAVATAGAGRLGATVATAFDKPSE